MRQARVYVQDEPAGVLSERKEQYVFTYDPAYGGHPISLTMPVRDESYVFETFPPFFDNLLPEGVMLEALLRKRKVDRSDRMGQLLIVGADMVGAVTVFPLDAEQA